MSKTTMFELTTVGWNVDIGTRGFLGVDILHRACRPAGRLRSGKGKN